MRIMLGLACWFSFAMASERMLPVNVQALEAIDSRLPFKSQTDRLSLSLASPEFEKLRAALEKRDGKRLQFETPVTLAVITTSEWRVISQVLKMKTLEGIAQEFKIQQAPFKVLCLKKVPIQKAGKTEESWYIELASEALLSIRQKIWHKFLAHGGVPAEFPFKRWKPHITLGFTAPEAHDEDMISKHKSECEYQLRSP